MRLHWLAAGLLLVVSAVTCQAGTLYISSVFSSSAKTDNVVFRVDTVSGAESQFANFPSGTGNGGPTRMALDRSGNLFVVLDAGFTGSIEEFTPNGTGHIFVPDMGQGITPSGLGFDPAGNLLVGLGFTAYPPIRVYSPTGVLLPTPAGIANVASVPVGAIALEHDAAGDLFILSYSHDSIYKVTPDGTGSLLSTVRLEPTIWSDMVLDKFGNIYASNETGNRIDKIAPDGTRTVFTADGTVKPESLTFDEFGNLYVGVVGAGHFFEILKITPSGQRSIVATLPDNYGIFDMVYQPTLVPEPATVSMLVVGGLASVAFTRGRRSSRRSPAGRCD